MNVSRLLPLLVVLTSLAATARAQFANGIKAIVQDSVITLAEVEQYSKPAAEALLRQFRGQPDAFQQKLATEMDKSLEELIDRELVLYDFKSTGYNFPEAIIDEAVEERIRSQYGDDRSKLIKSLQVRGMTYEKFRQNQREQVIIEALTAKNVSQETFISPHKIETFYLAHKYKYQLEDQVKLRMIVLNKNADTPARALAEEILRKLKEGAAFSEMASVYSQGAQRREGGAWGWVEKSVLRKELADVAFNLQAGQLSDLIDTPEAIYLMLVEDKRTSHVRPLTEIRDEIERQLRTEEQSRLRKLYIDRLRKKTFVLYF
jgi:peptidyl-prolyl cis-trans isomerase SurA